MRKIGSGMLEKLGVAAPRHPRGDECEGVVKAWLSQHAFLGGHVTERKHAAWKFASLCSLMYPRSDIAFTSLAACFTHWIAVVDDVVESAPGRVQELRRAHESADRDGEWGALVGAWGDIEACLTFGADDAFRERVQRAFGQLFDAYAWEARLRSERRLPTLDELVTYRHSSGGLPLYLLLLERGVGGPLPASVVAAPWFSELGALAGNLTCFANDLLSFEWDRDADNPVNLARVLSGGSEAKHEVVEGYFLDEWQRMLRLAGEGRQRVAGETKAEEYLDSLPCFVTGVFVWMDETRRYAAAETA